MLVPPQTLPGEQLWCACRTVYLGHTARPERHNWLLMHAGATGFVVRAVTAFGWLATEMAVARFLADARFASMRHHVEQAMNEWPGLQIPSPVPEPAEELVGQILILGDLPR